MIMASGNSDNSDRKPCVDHACKPGSDFDDNPVSNPDCQPIGNPVSNCACNPVSNPDCNPDIRPSSNPVSNSYCKPNDDPGSKLDCSNHKAGFKPDSKANRRVIPDTGPKDKEKTSVEMKQGKSICKLPSDMTASTISLVVNENP